ncbi:MAG: class I SAM-dependent methyltransferase [Candidatus Aenigmarchaeota archaeon]|nr:class I SAM-dependent methyltransferase [Candidatus Aenigmarchaeota archaeon]
MKFREYLPLFEGDLWSEGRRRLGDKLELYDSMQRQINNRYKDVVTYREFIKKFCALNVSSGMHELLLSMDPCTKWDAEEISREIEGTSATDLGCCDGTLTIFYALNHPEIEFTGVDMCHEAVDIATEKSRARGAKNTRFVCADVMSCEGEYFSADTLIAQGSVYQFLPHLTDYNRNFMETIRHGLRTGCKVILSQSIPNKSDQFRPEKVDGYKLLRYDTKTVHSLPLETDLSSEIAVFRTI